MRVAFSSFFLDSSGYGEMSRRYLSALLQTDGVDVTPGGVLVDGGWRVNPSGLVREFLQRKRVAPPDSHLLCIAGMDMPRVTPPEIPGDVPRIGALCWETDRLHPGTVAGCRSVQRLIVPSQHNADVLERAGLKATVVPIPVEVPTYVDELPLQGLEDVSPETFVFYSVLTWQERKNPIGLISAYCQAFTASDPVALVLKVNGPVPAVAMKTAGQITESILRVMALPDAPKIHIVGGTWSEAGLWALHYRGDCYISLAKGEAYGLPLLDAAAVGNRVIAVPYGGHVDFLPAEITSYVRYRMEPVMQQYAHFDGRQCWADPDVLHAAELMRAVYDAGQKPKMLADFSPLLPYAIGSRLKEALSV